jgi:adenylate cyclase
MHGPEKVLPSISHVDLSDAEVTSLGMKGGDREDFARLVKVLSAAGASSIVFDIIFPERGERTGDADFVQAVQADGHVTLPVILRVRGADEKAGPSAVDPQLAPRLWHPKVLRPGSPLTARASTLSFPALSAAARGIAHINSEPDLDGVLRRMPLLVACGDGYIPSLALAAAVDVLQVDPAAIEVRFGRFLRLSGARMPDGSERDIRIPIDAAGRMIVDYAGPWGAGFAHYPFSRLLAAETDSEAADQAASELDGAHLIISDITTSSGDYGPVPFERDYPRSGVHANILNSILSDRFLRAPGPGEVLLLNLAFAALLWLLAWRLRPLSCSLLSVLSWVVLAACEFALFVARGVMPALAAPTLGVVFVLIGINGYRFLLSEREKLAMRMRMERYFAPRLMSKILANQDRFMNADQKVITVLFSDIAGFTSWCTTQTPETIHRTLNEYFEVMTEIVFRHEGTVDKFIGDGLMAFFGDPLTQADHALRAVQTGIEMQQALRGLREGWKSEGRAELHIRIGINTGEVVVGDMGSRRIMAYTAIGANVNLGSRLESKAPIDGVLVSAAVHAEVKDAVSTRFAGRITAKGITEDFDTWEVLVP